jgi:hypothetical protein
LKKRLRHGEKESSAGSEDVVGEKEKESIGQSHVWFFLWVSF